MDKIKLVVSDIDGTLLYKAHILPEPLRREIWRIWERGAAFTFATGRLPFETDMLFSGLPPQEVPYVAGNGSIIKYRDAFLADKLFPTRILKPLAEKYAALGVTVIFNDGTLERPLLETEWSREHSQHFKGLDLPVEKTIWSKEIRRMYFYHPKGDYLFACLEELQADEILSHCSVCLQDLYSIQISARGCTKAEGVRKLSQICKIPRKNILCIGDSYNDISMIRYAGIGAAVGNACDELKQAADYVSDKCCGEGVADILQKLIP